MICPCISIGFVKFFLRLPKIHRRPLSNPERGSYYVKQNTDFNGVIALTYTLISVSSITYAMKAKNLLNNMGYYCEIEREDRNTRVGCGYSLRVRDDPRVISDILAKHGIAAKNRRTVERKT